MVIYKSDDLSRWKDVMDADICGTKMMRTNPRTGEVEVAYELRRSPVELLEEINMSGPEMFDEVWDYQETYSKVEDIYSIYIKKYDWSKIEIQDLFKYLHLSLPKNEKGHSIQLSSWKKWRNKEDIKYEFLNAPKEVLTFSEDVYLAKSFMRGGKVHLTSFLDTLNLEIEKTMKFTQPVLK